jgi:hypothetical protein
MGQRWIGSLTTPTTSAVREVGGHLSSAVAGQPIGRNAGFAQLRRFHNSYALYTAFLLAFASGARACAAYGWRATLDRRDWFCFLKDKTTGPHKQPHPMLLPKAAATQAVLFRAHCAALLRRSERRSVGTGALRNRLRAVSAAQPVPLLFLISRTGGLAKLGTAELRAAYPAQVQLVGDAGRHYFASFLFLQRVEDSFIDFFLRHAERGREPFSSTSLVSLRCAYERVCPLIDGHLGELGLGSLPGLAGD